METADIFFWSLLGMLFLAEILFIVLRVKKDNEVKEWVDPAFIAVLVAAVLRVFIIQAFRIPSQSMEDTFMIGDQILANKCAYGIMVPFMEGKVCRPAGIKRGEVVIFRYPQDMKMMFIKRCIGLPGDTIQIRNKQLYINGKKVIEPYVVHKDEKPAKDAFRDNFGPVKVPDNSYFMMGDNRDNSADSRYWGFLPDDYIRGRAWLVYWPPKRWKVIQHYYINADAKGNSTGSVSAVAVK